MAEDTVGESLQIQLEEIEVMRSIYGDAWRCEPGPFGSFSIDVKENNVDATLYLTLPETYPVISPPTYTLSAPTLSTQQKNELSVQLDNVYLENIGECVLYQWVEKVREFITEIEIDRRLINTNTHSTENKRVPDSARSGLEDEEEDEAIASALQNAELIEAENRFNKKVNGHSKSGDVLEIFHGRVITDRKSSFQGHLAKVTSQQQAKDVMDILMENKKIAHATHNMYAYRIDLPNSGTIQDCEDDGEIQAGSRMLHLLQILDVSNVIVVVSRWYGGIHLGPDRFRHINNVTRQVIEQAGLLKNQGSKS